MVRRKLGMAWRKTGESEVISQLTLETCLEGRSKHEEVGKDILLHIAKSSRLAPLPTEYACSSLRGGSISTYLACCRRFR